MLLADTGGLSAVSMRAVAGALNTTAGSLYRYLSSRDELLELMIDAVLVELPLDQDWTGEWLDDMMALASDQLAVYQRHPWLVEAGLTGGAIGPNATRYFEACHSAGAEVARGRSALARQLGYRVLRVNASRALGLSRPESIFYFPSATRRDRP